MRDIRRLLRTPPNGWSVWWYNFRYNFKVISRNLWFEVEYYAEALFIIMAAVAACIGVVLLAIGCFLFVACAPFIIIMYAAKLIFGG